MGIQVQKLVAGSCVWLMLGCSPGCSIDSIHTSQVPDENSEAAIETGKKYFFDGRYKEALKTWKDIKTQIPFSFRVDKWSARALLMLDRPEEAYQLLLPYMQIIPDHSELLHLLGKCRFEQSNYTEAFELLERGAAGIVGVAGIYLTRADMYYHLGLYSKAEEYKRIARLLLHLEEDEEEQDDDETF